MQVTVGARRVAIMLWGRLGTGLMFLATGYAVVACGSNSDAEAPSTEALIGDACAKIGSASCATQADVDQCNQKFAQKQAEATSESCEPELDAYLACVASNPVECASIDDSGLHPYPSSNCSELMSKFSQCWSHLPGECSVAVGVAPGPGGCALTCPGVKASCQGPDPNGPVDCICDEGPHAGLTFQATNCASNLSWATGHTCNY
jgi:hypothetical protein